MSLTKTFTPWKLSIKIEGWSDPLSTFQQLFIGAGRCRNSSLTDGAQALNKNKMFFPLKSFNLGIQLSSRSRRKIPLYAAHNLKLAIRPARLEAVGKRWNIILQVLGITMQKLRSHNFFEKCILPFYYRKNKTWWNTSTYHGFGVRRVWTFGTDGLQTTQETKKNTFKQNKILIKW